jgi:hypothetical protein
MASFIPRFGPLGRDIDGRVYWALSPGITERELALGFIGKKSGRGQKKAKGRRWGVSDDEREKMRKWSWFIAVWGRKPPAEVSEKEQLPRPTDDSEEDDDSEKWWGFCDPAEIRRLASYIGHRSGHASDGSVAQRSNGGSISYESSLPTDAEGSIGVNTPNQPPRKGDLEQLAKSLKDYADILEWRIKSMETGF